jgi:hypothetical protein
MSKSLTSTALINTIKRRASIPLNQNTFTETDILEMASEEISISLLPKVLELYENYYLTHVDVDITASQSRYDIPYRAIGNKVKDIFYVDSSGDLHPMTRVQVEDLPSYSGSSDYQTYYIQDNEISLYPEVSDTVTGKLRFFFYISPNSLVTENKVSKITEIDRVTGVITLNSLPTIFSSTQLYDFIQYRTPHKIIDYDMTALSVSGNTITFNVTDIPSNLTVNDYICLAGETFYPQIPSDLHSLLAQYVAVACLESQGDTENLKSALVKLDKMEKAVPRLINDRVEGSSVKVTTFGGLLRRSVGRYRG